MANESEILKIQSSDNPRMSLVSTPLDASSCLAWSRSVKIALGAKMKLAFINGKNPKPAEDSKEYEQWIRIGHMVTSWILNSISKEIVEAFLYTNTARELWLELEARFGEINRPMIYKLKREISSISQGTMSISAYYTNIKKLWDELICLNLVPQCSCGASKTIADLNTIDQLMQFLMGLSDYYDHVRNHILMMDHLPSMSKAYSMILRLEKHKEVNTGSSGCIQNMAMQARGGDIKMFISPKPF